MGLHQAERDGTVGKALKVLDQVADMGRPVRFVELLEGSPYPKGTLYRLIQTLTSQGMLTHDPHLGTYSLGTRLVRLANTALEMTSIAPIARPHLVALSAEVEETVHLAQLDNAHVLYLDKVNAQRTLKMLSEAGKIGPAYCTGVGKALLAHVQEPRLSAIIAQQSFHPFTDATHTDPETLRYELSQIVEDGVAFDRAEHEVGVNCIAAPVFGPDGAARAALSISTRNGSATPADLQLYKPALHSAAEKISADLAHWRFPNIHEGDTQCQG